MASERPEGTLTVTEMAMYRMKAANSELLVPILLWLHRPDRQIPGAVADAVIAVMESWSVRRQLLRLPASDLGRVVADVIKTYSRTDADELAEHVTAHMARLNVTSTYWPGDREMRTALATEPFYRRYTRGRLRFFLEALEDSYRTETRQPQVLRGKLPIEHILPQKWEDTWPVADLGAKEERQIRVNHLGNLTLLTTSLNSKLSNGTWPKKRAALLKHNTITLTGRVVETAEGRDWDETLIDERTDILIDRLLKIWPVPAGHEGKVIDPQTKVQDWVEIKHLVAAGALNAGDVLTAMQPGFTHATATVTADGRLEVEGRYYIAPSPAAFHYLQRAVNGWHFWRVADGRKLRDIRTEFLSKPAAEN